MLPFRAFVTNGYLGARNTSQHRLLVGTPELRNTSLTGKRAFRLIGCLILVVGPLSRPTFMSSFVSLMDAWGSVTGSSLGTKAPVHTGRWRSLPLKTTPVQGQVCECFQTRDVTRSHWFWCRFPNRGHWGPWKPDSCPGSSPCSRSCSMDSPDAPRHGLMVLRTLSPWQAPYCSRPQGTWLVTAVSQFCSRQPH